MAVLSFTDAYVSIAANVLSDHVKSITIPVEAEELDTTAMGATWKAAIAGLKSGSVQIEFNNDYAAANVDAILWPLLGTVVAFEVRPTSAAVGASNPKWTGSVLISQLTPVSGSVGELATTSVTWPTSGTVTRAVA